MSDLQRGAPRNEPRDPLALDDELMLAQVKAVLTPLPPVDRRHIAHILAATQERQRSPWQRLFGRLEDVLEWWRFNTPPVARGATLAAAALTIGFVARGYVMNPGAASSNTAAGRVALPAAAPAMLRAVEGPVEPSEQRLPTQFVLDARDLPTARSVSLVGDFNDWNVTATPLTLENGAWVATMPLLPGRHVYAFVVNGETWIADPRAPQATDSDFGRPGSVIIIQAP